MTDWFGFWIGAGIAGFGFFVGVGLNELGEAIGGGLSRLAAAYEQRGRIERGAR